MKRDTALRFGVLGRLPVNLFGSVMGIAGLSLAWKHAASYWHFSGVIGDAIGVIAFIVFVLLLSSYALKWLFFPLKVNKEFNHPITGNFFGTIPIGILLLSAVTGMHFPMITRGIWMVGMVTMLTLSYVIVRRLLTVQQDHINATPAWLIPGVGALDIAVTGGGIPFEWAKEINLLSFAMGIILALVFFTMIVSRLIHNEKLSQRMEPSLLILIAPFAVGFLGYFSLSHQVDLFASILFYFGLFMFTIVFSKVFLRKIPFMLTWWAVGFPIAALSNAALKYAIYKNSLLPDVIAGILLLVLTGIIAYMLVKSLLLLFTKRLFLS
ncbi:SLAC1 anion channel family protein [Flavobacterium sp. XGLA_31]|uniref:SLAC1 anion channel family protein n=1 Tax=Flavobacterium sp. XGLA_31 TaxID=3447666 RepID=UPI003F3E5AE3